MEQKFLCITRKELFYVAVMLHIKRLVNVVYDFPADEMKFDKELNEAKASLRKKALLVESAREGVSLDFAVSACAAFCSEPESCEVVDKNGYYATLYHAANIYMLLEKRSDNDLAAAWFIDKGNLDRYIETQTKA